MTEVQGKIIKLLLVDDEQSVISALKRILRSQNIEVLSTTDPDEAVAMCEKHKPDGVVSDFRMEKMNGVEFLMRVRAVHPSAFRVILSGYSDKAIIETALKNGDVEEYWLKPWNNEFIAHGVKRMLESRPSGGKPPC